jgi:hypothetical protein
MSGLSLDNLNEPIKSSEYTGSNEPSKSVIPEVLTEEQVHAERDKIIQLSNDSIMHGYDLAIEIVAGHGNSEAVRVLAESRSAIEVGLHKSKAERIEGNFGTQEAGSREENNTTG